MKKYDCFNPYSPGFSIYLIEEYYEDVEYQLLQSLFTWIFYLFPNNKREVITRDYCFNPYSPGFSIYLNR